jgi:hypothetical protein
MSQGPNLQGVSAHATGSSQSNGCAPCRGTGARRRGAHPSHAPQPVWCVLTAPSSLLCHADNHAPVGACAVAQRAHRLHHLQLACADSMTSSSPCCSHTHTRGVHQGAAHTAQAAASAAGVLLVTHGHVDAENKEHTRHTGHNLRSVPTHLLACCAPCSHQPVLFLSSHPTCRDVSTHLRQQPVQRVCSLRRCLCICTRTTPTAPPTCGVCADSTS